MAENLASRMTDPIVLDRGPKGLYEAHSEEAFRHFLSIERKRAERSARSLLLVLIDLSPADGRDAVVTPEAAAEIFSTLNVCVRETDFIGWYRASRVIGAVLAQGADAPAPDVSQQIGERVGRELSALLPADLAGRIHVRVLQLHSSLRS